MLGVMTKQTQVVVQLLPRYKYVDTVIIIIIIIAVVVVCENV